MFKRSTLVLGVLGLSLLLRADSCLLEQRDVDVVLGTDIPAEWVSQGFTDASGLRNDTLAVNPTQDLVDALDDLDSSGTLESIAITGAGFEVLSSAGHDARRSGTITVNGQPLVEFNSPTNAAGTQAFATASGTPIDPATTSPQLRLRSAGLDLVNQRLDQFLQQYRSGLTPDPGLLELTYVANWVSSPAPTAADPDDFTWTTTLQVQIVQKASLDVPNP